MSCAGTDTPKTPWERHFQAGWSLIEVVVTTAIVGTLGVAVVMSMMPQIATSQRNQCMANLQMIESAKNSWVADHPGQAMATPPVPNGTDDPLVQYIRGGTIPSCPRDQSTYLNLYDPTKPATCTCPYHKDQYGNQLQAYPTPTPSS